MIEAPYIILELANTHGGDKTYMHSLIDAFATYQGNYGMKFQPLSPDTLATPDFQWYPVYQTLYFNPQEWHEIIQLAKQTKDIWIDLFDLYGVQIVSENLPHVHGIKFQSSVLHNEEVISALSSLDLTHCRVILNIAAQEIEVIKQRIDYIKHQLNPKELLLEIGFQAYPTELSDSGLSKIKQINEAFGLPIVFADHIDGTATDSIYLPIMAWLQGATVLEKHVMLSDRETKYDHFSSQTPETFNVFTTTLAHYVAAMHAEFINPRERDYLQKTVMIPVVRRTLYAGDFIHSSQDLFFRRSGKEGLTLDEIKALQTQRMVLNKQKDLNDTLRSDDFKPAKVGVIVACRMKSSRLKEKALLPIGDLPSVEFCLRNALKFKGIHKVILATSTEAQDQILERHTFDPKVGFYQGHPEDVMQRYIDVCEAYDLDVVVRITADMPFVDDEICSFLLEEHFKSGAEYTVGSDAAVGVNLEIFNVSCLKRIKAYFPNAEYSEYMTWYFQNNPDQVRIHKVDLPEIFVRPYRLTLDYEEDLTLFNEIHEEVLPFAGTEYTLRDVITYLDHHPEIAAINSHLTLKYKTDQALIDLLNEKTKIK
jgi:spore coat polysaccharide biosynthesis protein SpsF (cytidylyltransferase family)/sialic acid synthase SpsE